MKLFGERQVRTAIAHARAGGQALHLFRPMGGLRARAPQSFRRAEVWAHLFDRNEERLRVTVRRLGVRHVVVDRFGSEGQHVDLCGGPLLRAVLAAIDAQDGPTSASPLRQVLAAELAAERELRAAGGASR